MKFLKLVNVPLGIFKDPKYGARVSGGLIPWRAMGFNSMVTKTKNIQYFDLLDNQLTYLPIVDQLKTEAILGHIATDMAVLKTNFPDKEYSAKIVEDDFDQWKAIAESISASNSDNEPES
tara:strand:- start:6404 stop:6763 length:360 start_codon:yes stop_codon:yes gene_type:complete